MCCSVGFARSLGLALLPLALCCILANLLLLFPMGEIHYIQQDRLASYIWYFGGLGGGGLLMLVPAVVFITLGKCSCCWNESLMVSAAAGDLVPVCSAASHRRVERDSAVRPAGFGCAGVHPLPLTAGERFGQRRLPALLLQAGVQPQRVDKRTRVHVLHARVQHDNTI
ncbi:transmembrane 4 L6 family member 18 isoform X2 [Scophthalmus maximus]|uniref:transmembrane 4 L6 family member 18 isoform X2 n=1 Tax=Scophthalmus maximus TaxID=52904 RepID=UPI0015E0FEFD|nr:transmembrane 4 L6 family member 18 isoform X2 [Scophthalmus maximus]